MTCKWQVEIDEYARRVLAKHWPDVPRWDDIRTFPPGPSLEDWRVDLLCGGFPCTDISFAGKGAGLDGKQSGLWFEFERVIRVLRPRWVFVENVPALLVRGFDRVLGSLADLGYDAEWQVLSAAQFGAPHLRKRVWIVAYAERLWESQPERSIKDERRRVGDGSEDVAHANEQGLEGRRVLPECSGERAFRKSGMADTVWVVCQPGAGRWRVRQGGASVNGGNWATEPDVGRVAHGVPSRVDRLRCLGNAIVPQIAEWIGRQLISSLTTDRDSE